MAAAPNVWTQMDYVPPRGPCNFKPNIMSARCPCLRFMLHPLKSASSYECDGCNHHASFHSMENKHDDEIRKRWELEAKEKQSREDREVERPRKRLRQIENGDAAADDDFARRLEGVLAAANSGTGRVMAEQAAPAKATKGRKQASASKARINRASARSKAPDDDYMEVVEVD